MSNPNESEASPTPSDKDAGGGRRPSSCSVELVWHPGPARGGGGTAQEHYPEAKFSWWRDGDLLLIVVGKDFVRLVSVNADGDHLSFEEPDSRDDIGYTAEDISWWARIEESLPQNA